MNNKEKKLLVCCSGLVLLLLVILLPISYQYVGFTEYGLRYNTITKQVSPTEAFEAHRHFGGPSIAYHIYPKTVQFVIFNETGLKKPIGLKDKIGGSFEVEMNMGYQLLKESIYDIFRTYKFRYEDSYLTNIRAAVRQKAQEYSMLDFVQDGKREQLEVDIAKIVVDVLKPRFTLKSETSSSSTTSEVTNTQNASLDLSTGTYDKCPSEDASACDFKGGAKLVFFHLGLVKLDSAKEGIILNTEKNNIQPRISLEGQKLEAITKDTEIIVEAKRQNLTTLQQTLTAGINAIKTQILKEEKKILDTTQQAVKQIEAEAARNVTVIDSETSNFIQEKQRFIDLARQETVKLENKILQETAVLRAETDKTLVNIKAESDAKIKRYTAAANANAKKIKAKALQNVFNAFATNLSFTPKELNTLQWTDYIAEHDGKLHVDIQRPTSLNLEGQQESYFNTLDSSRL